MSSALISHDTPRSSDDRTLQRSLVRPTFGRRIFAVESVFCAYHVLLATKDPDLGTIAGWLAATVVWLVLCAWIWKHPRKLGEVWTAGTVADITVVRSYFALMIGLSAAVVEHHTHRAWVLLRGEVKKGTRLRALVHDEWVAVVDPNDRLRVARLR
jgi:hypothetical protein